ncbi:hypothetical protein HF086_009107, partial [Spodoptera exigua]
SKTWSDGSLKGIKKPVSKGQRLAIVHAGSEAGFVPNALLLFKAGAKSEDYHDNMNFENYTKWLRTQLIPNLPPNSVGLYTCNNMVISYHYMFLEKTLLICGLNVNQIISHLEEDDDVFAADIFITPPDNWQNSDEDSGDEEFASINNLSRHQLLAEAELGSPDRLNLSLG